jgi:hypothetical protein
MPVDLTKVLDGTWQPPKPTVGQRNDGVGLFYPGKLHSISSESEAGKTWLVIAAAFHELQRGNHVCYIDFEDDEGGVVGRLLTMQAPVEWIRERFHYIRPTDRLTNDDIAHVRAVMTNLPTLAVVDGMTEAMSMHNLNPLDNKDIAEFGNILPRKLTYSGGCATVCLDHVVKANDSRGRYALGGVHKLNGLDGAAYILENRNPFGIGMRGVSTIRIAKDRPGQLRRNAVPNKSGMFWFADLIVDTTIDGLADGAVTVAAPDVPDDFKPTVIMARIAGALTGKPDGLSQHVLCDVVTGRAETIRVALSHLIADGYVSPKTPHKLINDYPGDTDLEE